MPIFRSNNFWLVDYLGVAVRAGILCEHFPIGDHSTGRGVTSTYRSPQFHIISPKADPRPQHLRQHYLDLTSLHPDPEARCAMRGQSLCSQENTRALYHAVSTPYTALHLDIAFEFES